MLKPPLYSLIQLSKQLYEVGITITFYRSGNLFRGYAVRAVECIVTRRAKVEPRLSDTKTFALTYTLTSLF